MLKSHYSSSHSKVRSRFAFFAASVSNLVVVLVWKPNFLMLSASLLAAFKLASEAFFRASSLDFI